MTKNNTNGQTPMLQEESASDEISLIDLFLILWKGKYIVAACTFLAIIVGILYALNATEFFSTSSNFITMTGKQKGANLSQLASLAGISIGSSGSVDPSDYLDKVIQDKGFLSTLFERKWFFKGDTLPLEQILEIKPDTTIPNWENSFFMKKINSVRDGKILSLRKDAKTGILTLSSEAPDPQLAYDLNVFTLDYISSYIRNSLKSQAKEKRLFIEDRIRETKKALEKSEDALAKFRGSNFMTRSPQALLEEARLTRDAAMNQEIYIQFQKQYELARIEELDDQTLIQVVKGAEVPVERSKPKRKMIVILSLLCGIFIGLSSVFIWQSIRLLYNATLSKEKHV